MDATHPSGILDMRHKYDKFEQPYTYQTPSLFFIHLAQSANKRNQLRLSGCWQPYSRMRLIYLKIFLLTTWTAFSQVNCDKYSTDYVPKNLTEAVNYLDCVWPVKDKKEFKSKNENDATAELHMGTGRSMKERLGTLERQKLTLQML